MNEYLVFFKDESEKMIVNADNVLDAYSKVANQSNISFITIDALFETAAEPSIWSDQYFKNPSEYQGQLPF